ncbi:hypothetical protein EST38_g4123 [Candolleomyces aberdarensis]|uniref:Uncharacterized protein n=1 Tax=Candolleomyces aberdarensis TaxID=2316362 RepID=A0A4Q2DRS2_9AGAR|nr:hypothetical protein EST38_g4123 [Candolleomyces aberdarensis]
MLSRFACALTVLAVSAGVLAQGPITINTPLSVVVCQPVQFTWTGGTGPFFLPGAAAIVDFGRQDASPFTWNPANLPVGTSFFLQLRDSTGQVGQSGTATIQTGSDTSCVGQTTSTTSTATTGGTTTTGTTPGATTTGTTSPAATTSPRGTTGTTSPAGSTTGTASGASQTNGAAKFASSGALGLAGVAAIAALL